MNVEDLLTGAHGRVRSVRAELREWSDPGATRAALERLYPGAGASVPGDGPREELSRHWFAAPDRVREERAGAVTVRRGDAWWMQHPVLGRLANEGDPQQATTGGELIRRWVDPSPILPLVELTVVDTATAAGRPALHVRAVPREGPAAIVDLAFLGSYADAWELEVDAERGVLLGTAAFAGGRRFEAVEAAQLAFDEDLDDDLFEPAP